MCGDTNIDQTEKCHFHLCHAQVRSGSILLLSRSSRASDLRQAKCHSAIGGQSVKVKWSGKTTNTDKYTASTPILLSGKSNCRHVLQPGTFRERLLSQVWHTTVSFRSFRLQCPVQPCCLIFVAYIYLHCSFRSAFWFVVASTGFSTLTRGAETQSLTLRISTFPRQTQEFRRK